MKKLMGLWDGVGDAGEGMNRPWYLYKEKFFFHFSKPAMGRSDTEEQLLAWKTAVNQMAGTGYGFGMSPVTAPGFSDQYSQSPPT